MSFKKTLALLLGGAPLLLASANAFAWVPLDGSTPTWSPNPTYLINTGSIPGSISGIGVARVDAGFATWGAPACTTFGATNGGSTNLSYNYQDDTNVIRWLSNNWPAQLGDVNSVIGVTMPVWNGNNHFTDADIVFNDVGFNWNDSGNNNNVDTQSIATHEQGHFLGLDHTNVNGATMESFYSGGTSLRTLDQDDIDGVCALYPVGGTAASSGSGGGGDCNSCINDSVDNGGACVGDYNACGQSQACIDLYDCFGTCQTQACYDQCQAQYPNGVTPLGNLFDCWCTTCATECTQECGGSSGSTSASSTTSGGQTSGGQTSGGNTAGSTTDAASGTGTGAGAGGAGAGSGTATGAGAGNLGSTSGNGDDDPIPKSLRDPDADSGCAMGGNPAGVGALLLFSAIGAAFARRRRR